MLFVEFVDTKGKRHLVNTSLVTRISEHNDTQSVIIFNGDMITVPGTVDDVCEWFGSSGVTFRKK